jgi:hypothetical protein
MSHTQRFAPKLFFCRNSFYKFLLFFINIGSSVKKEGSSDIHAAPKSNSAELVMLSPNKKGVNLWGKK